MEVKKLDSANLKEICRLCLKTPGRKIGIFEEEGQHRQIGYKIRSCLPDLIYPGDPLPQYICPGCLIKLENNFEFLQKYLKNSRILRNVLLKEIKEETLEAQNYIQLWENSMCPRKPTIHENSSAYCQEDDSIGGEMEEHEDFDWQPAEAFIGLVPKEEIFQIFLEDGPSDLFLPEPDDLTLMSASHDNFVRKRTKEDNLQQHLKPATADVRISADTSQPVAKCSISALPEISGLIKQEPEEAEEQEIDVTWLVESADQEEDALDISKVKREPVSHSLSEIKQEQSEPVAASVMSIDNPADVKGEALASCNQSRTRSRRINVECSKCFLVFHSELQILRHRCIGVSPWYCKPCNKYYKSKETFSKHKKYISHSKEIMCTACDSIFPSRIKLAHHQMTHLRIKIKQLDFTKLNTCKTCNQTFISEASLNIHEKSHLNINERNHYLSSTESKLLHVVAIPQSTEVHSGPEHSSNIAVANQQCATPSGKEKHQYHCPICKAIFTNQKVFVAHNRQHHLKNKFIHKQQLSITEHKLLNVPTISQSNETRSGLAHSSNRNAADKQCAEVSGRVKYQYHCTVCKAVFTNQKVFMAHNGQHRLKYNKKSLSCTESKFPRVPTIPQSTKTNLVLAHSSNIDAADQQCPEVSRRVKHQYNCTECKAVFTNQKVFMTHNRQHHLRNELKYKKQSLNSTESKFLHVPTVPQSTETHSVSAHSSGRDIADQQNAEVSRKVKHLYSCTECKAVFTNQKVFMAHNHQHSIKNEYELKKQLMAFKTQRNKGQYETVQHIAVKLDTANKRYSVADRYACIICRKSFDTQEILIEHKKLHTPARKALDTRPFSAFTTGNGTVPVSEWVCKICGLDCGQSTILWSHMHEKHSRMSYKCRHCPKTFDKLCSLKSHEKSHEPKLTCTACGKQYSTLKALAAHEQSKHLSTSASHLCRKCNIKFDSRSALLIHARNHQSLPKMKKNFASVTSKSPQSSHTCSICARTFSKYDSLKRHESIHATGKHTFYPCHFCGLKLVSVPSYKAHTERHFQKMEKTQCPTCKRTYFTQDFSKHFCVKQQHGLSTSQVSTGKKFRCELCGALFASQQARNSHMRIHRKNWKYSTQRMEETTPIFQKSTQNSGNISYTIYCPLCSKAFLSQEELQHHVKVHHSKR